MTAWIRCFIVGLILLFSACAVVHTDLREGIRSFKAQDYRDAFVRLMPEARRGQIDAQYAIGFMYYYGKGVVEDRRKAIFWIRTAACRGHTGAVQALELIHYEAACFG